MTVSSKVLEQKEYMVSLRRHFHRNPELSGKEYETATRIEKELDDIGIPNKRIGETGIAGFLNCGKDNVKTIAFRADIDALPVSEQNNCEYKSQNEGVMHACGHDAHAAALLGTARILASLTEKLNCDIIFIFQQAEEIGAGAKQVIQSRILDGIDSIFGIHMASFLPYGKVSVKSGESGASCDYFKINITGKSAHVSKPHEGIDAVYIAAQTVLALQSIAARQTNPLEPVVVGIGRLEAGTAYNIIAGEAVLEGTTRAFNNESREKVNNLVTQIAKDTAALYGASAEVEFRNYSAPVINSPKLAKYVEAIAAKTVGNENVITDSDKTMMADDFADYLLTKKGFYVFVGSCNSEATAFQHHNERFDIEEDAILVASDLFLNYAMSYQE